MSDNELAIRDAGEVVQPRNMLDIVMRAAQDPAIDPVRLREFLTIGRELEADRAKQEYNIAWARLMPELPTITKNGLIIRPAKGENKGSKTPYAKWDDVHTACMPVLYANGFAVSFDSETKDTKLIVSVKITHSSGHQEISRLAVPWLDSGGSKSPAQEAASAYTVAKRHAFCNAFNILTRDQDDDGSGQGVPEWITEAQLMRIGDIVQECSNREPGFPPRWAKWLKSQFNVDGPAKLCQGAQLKAVMSKLAEKQAELGVK